jgi:hypothetical protein
MSSSKRTQGRKTPRRPKRDMHLVRPPQLRTYPQLTHTYRFFANSPVTNVEITNDLLFGAAGGICTVANSAVTCIFGCLRIRRVEIWAPLLSSGTNEVEILWGNQSTLNSNPVRVTDVSVSTAFPAHIRTSPPRNSTASFWQNIGISGGVPMFHLSCSTGAYIDVTLDLIMWNNEGSGFSTNVGVGVLGDIYYMSLDGPTTHDLQPIGLNTTN